MIDRLLILIAVLGIVAVVTFAHDNGRPAPDPPRTFEVDDADTEE